MSGAGIPDNCQIYQHDMFPIELGTEIFGFLQVFFSRLENSTSLWTASFSFSRGLL